MKTFNLVFAILSSILAFGQVHSQSEWYPLNSGTTEHLRDVYFSSTNTGFVVGGEYVPTILKTGDGGNTWSKQTFQTGYFVASIRFTDANTGFAAGGSDDVGTIFKTIDAGETWNLQTLGSNRFYGISFPESNIGYAAGVAATIVKTTDAGASWTTLNPATSAWFSSLYFIDANTGWVVGQNGTILKTTDGGETWITQNSGTGEWINSVFFINADNGVACAKNGIIIKTSNAGVSWSQIFSGTNKSLNKVYFLDESTGYIVGDDGLLLKTTDAGNTWIQLNTGTTTALSSVHFTSANIGYICGNEGTLLKTTDSEYPKMHLSASVANLSDQDNYAGYSAAASDGFDSEYDVPEPGAPPSNYVQLYFPHPEWQHPLGENFTRDIRAQADLTDAVMTWDFEVDTDQQGSVVTLTFTPEALAGTIGLKLIDLDDNETLNLRETATYTYTADLNRNFQLVIGDATPPLIQVTYPNGGEVISSSTCTITWSASDGSGIAAFDLEYSTDAGQTYIPIATVAGDVRSYLWTVPQTATYTAMVRIRATDNMWHSASDASDNVFVISPEEQAHAYAAGWNMMSVPLQPDNPLATEVIGDDASSYYFLFDYLPERGYAISDYVYNGKGYWLASPAEINLDVQGTPVTTTTYLTTVPGWNIIGNPLTTAMDTAKVDVTKNNETVSFNKAVRLGWISGVLYNYSAGNPGYQNSTVLNQWLGYWFMAFTDGVSLVFDPNAASEPGAQNLAKIASAEAWSITVEARSDPVSDLISCFGVAPDATDGFDPLYDEPEPPLPPSGTGISLYFPHPEWGAQYGNKFNRDTRSPLAPNELRTWSFEVQRHGAVELSWTAVQIDGYSFWLKDLDTGSAIDMTQQTGYSYTSSEKIRHFCIEVGNGISDASPSPSVLPGNWALLQNYPNPFNPVTTIQFEIPQISAVKLTVSDVTGREIAILIDQELPAGRHACTWDASTVASGVYFCKLRADTRTEIRKMILIK